MRTLYIHCGLPKTGTTSIQTSLTSRREELRTIGYSYPSVGLSAVGNAHHNISLEILNRPDFAPERGGVGELLRDLERVDRPPNVVISSENFVNCISRIPQGDNRFVEFVRAAMERNDRVRLIFMFRRFARFFESMYLQRMKTGRPNSKVPEFVFECKQWTKSILNALSALSREIGRENLILIDLEREGGDALPLFLSTVGIPQSATPSVRLNERLGLKKTAFLYRFQYAAEGIRNDRSDKEVLRAGRALLRMPDLPGEIFDYRILPFDDANAIQQIARTEMPPEFASAIDSVATAETQAYTAVELPNVHLTESELAAMTSALPRFLPRAKKKAVAPVDTEIVIGI